MATRIHAPDPDITGPWLKAGATSAVYFLAGALLLALGGYDVYADAVAQGDALWTTLAENAVTFAMGGLVIAAGAWITRKPDEQQLRALALWTGVALAFLLGITGVVLGMQALQSHWKPWMIYGNFAGALLLAGFATGLYASWLQRKAYYDPLTALPNRNLLEERLKRSAGGASFALLYLDLDHFTDVNEGFGRSAGDRLLRIVARRVMESLNGNDMAARIGSDELAVVAWSATDREAAQKYAESLKRLFQEHIHLGEQQVRIQASVGIAMCPEDATDPRELLQCADAGVRYAERSGGNQWAFYSHRLVREAANRVIVSGRLRTAIDQGEIHTAFQPIVRLADERIVGYEALARWYNPERGWVSPAEFIPVAEQNGLIDELARVVAGAACRAIAETANDPDGAIYVSLNISPLQVSRPEFADELRGMCERAGAPPEKLVLEITEQAMLALDTAVLRRLDEIRSAGISVAIDDFGTGYASLSYIKHLPADMLKVDRKFISEIDSDRGNQAIAAATLTLAREFGLTQTAEGVETRAEADKLQEMGYTTAQGFLFGKPRVAASG